MHDHAGPAWLSGNVHSNLLVRLCVSVGGWVGGITSRRPFLFFPVHLCLDQGWLKAPLSELSDFILIATVLND